jgi:hypothetical protein
MEATTPALKQYLEQTIARSEELAGEFSGVPKRDSVKLFRPSQ